MHLTTFTDYSLRVLMYLKLNTKPVTTVAEISAYFQVSQNHIVKVVNNLGKLGLITTLRGKGGGIGLVESTNSQKIGDLVRKLEPEKELVQCINKKGDLCAISQACNLIPIIDNALDSFYQHLNQYTLEEIVSAPEVEEKPITLDSLLISNTSDLSSH